MSTIGSSVVLVIDSDVEVCDRIVGYLSQRGYQVRDAHDSEQANDIYQRMSPDVVVCDVNFPFPAESSLIETIYQSDAQLVLTADRSSAQLLVEGLRQGAADYLFKPIPDMALLELIISKARIQARLLKQNHLYSEELVEKNLALEETVRLLEEDQQAGRQVQMKMFPATPAEINHFRFEHHIIPSLYLSGDFVDYYPIDHRYVGFYLADVSGHGASSAFVTVLIKNFVERLRRRYRMGTEDTILDPAKTLARINEEFISLKLGKHLAIFCGVIDSVDKVLKYSGGAHFPPPLLISCEGCLKTGQCNVEALHSSGLPVGIFPNADYEAGEIALAERFSLVVFSDGILELLGKENLQEKESFLLEIVRQGNHTISALARALELDDLEEVPDDVAILAVSGEC